jgi:TonB family protein
VVEGFHFQDGSITPFGFRLADSLSYELAKIDTNLVVIDPNVLQHKLEVERLNPQTQVDPLVTRWLARTVKADAILVGKILSIDDGSVELSAMVLNANSNKAKVLSIKTKFRVDVSKADASTIPKLPDLPSFGDTFEGEPLYKPSRNLLPSCSYMPNPPYTDEAKRVGLEGTLLLEGIIRTDGKIVKLRVVKGLPYGLNDSAITTLQSWRCKATKHDGKSVPVLVPFEIHFHQN